MQTTITRPDGTKELTSDILQRCQHDPKRFGPTIRRLARHDGLVAHKDRRRYHGQWYFIDPERNLLMSPETGLDEVEALEWLLQE